MRPPPSHDSTGQDRPTTSRSKRWRDANYMLWKDHELLRYLWTNRVEIAPGVWRGNQPTPKGWQWLQQQGIHSVLNLRAQVERPYTTSARDWTGRLGLSLVTLPMAASLAPKPETLRQLLGLFRTLERPFFMHCKSGADRSGLAAALYLREIEGAPPEAVRAMLSRRFIHLRHSRKGVLDAFLDDLIASGQSLEAYLDAGYDPAALQARYDAEYAQRGMREKLAILWKG